MKFAMLCRNVGASIAATWIETYTVHTDSPLEYAKNLVESFNTTLMPHEKPREVLMVRILDAKPVGQHDFEKTSLVTIYKNGETYDAMKCLICGATGMSRKR